MFGWIPVIGPFIDLVKTWITKTKDTDLEKYKVNGEVNIEAMKQDTAIILARTDLAKIMANDPTTRWGRRLFIYPTGIWFCAIVIDSLLHRALNYTYRVEALPENLAYIPHAVVAYLLITAWKK